MAAAVSWRSTVALFLDGLRSIGRLTRSAVRGAAGASARPAGPSAPDPASQPASARTPRRPRRRTVIVAAVTAAVLAVPGWLWFDSLLPDSYSAMDRGH